MPFQAIFNQLLTYEVTIYSSHMSKYTNTLFMGKVLLRYKSVKSTNLSAQSLLAAEKPPEGTVLMAEEQTAGRGQRGNSWVSPAGNNLLSSFILYPKQLSPKQQFLLNMMTSLAMMDLLEDLNIHNASIKWPNDVYIGKKKVAGILIQNNITNHTIQSAIVGIGLNVNQTQFDPKLPNPTSLAQELGGELVLEDTLEKLAYFLEKRYLQLKSKSSIAKLSNIYTEHMYRLGKVASYEIDDKPQAGIIEGIDESGKLIVRLEETTRVFDLQEIRFLQ